VQLQIYCTTLNLVGRTKFHYSKTYLVHEVWVIHYTMMISYVLISCIIAYFWTE